MSVNPSNNDFLLSIQSAYPSLTKAEKKVADYILQNSKAVRFMSITGLADACHVSLTSVFRFCKVMKLQGYQEFKVRLALSMNDKEELEESQMLPAAVTKADSVDIAAQKLLQSHINALVETHAMVDAPALRKAANYINRSDQVRFFGVGGYMLTAMEGMYKFLHIMPNVYCLSDTHMQTMGASTLNQHDTAIFISHSGASKEMVNMIQKAHENGAKTVVITRYAKSPIAEFADVVLLCGGFEPPLQEGSFPSKTAQLLVLDLLFTEVYRTKFDYSKEINKIVTTSILDKDY